MILHILKKPAALEHDQITVREHREGTHEDDSNGRGEVHGEIFAQTDEKPEKVRQIERRRRDRAGRVPGVYERGYNVENGIGKHEQAQPTQEQHRRRFLFGEGEEKGENDRDHEDGDIHLQKTARRDVRLDKVVEPAHECGSFLHHVQNENERRQERDFCGRRAG